MRIAGAGIPGTVIVYMRLVYRRSDSGLRCAYGNARQIQANGVLRIRAAPGRASHECGRVCHRNARGRNTSRPCCVAESPWADGAIGSRSPEESTPCKTYRTSTLRRLPPRFAGGDMASDQGPLRGGQIARIPQTSPFLLRSIFLTPHPTHPSIAGVRDRITNDSNDSRSFRTSSWTKLPPADFDVGRLWASVVRLCPTVSLF